jgi:hypothetical protein
MGDIKDIIINKTRTMRYSMDILIPNNVVELKIDDIYFDLDEETWTSIMAPIRLSLEKEFNG